MEDTLTTLDTLMTTLIADSFDENDKPFLYQVKELGTKYE